MVESIHQAARAFGVAVEDYERGRPSYPTEAVAWLAARLRIGPGSTVLDLAAGSGKLTRALVPTGANVVAVEPVDGMRARLEAELPGVRALSGTAEAIPLPDGSTDAVTVAQGFHWFDGDRALEEIHRVLRPRGRLGLIWNRRDERSPLQARLTEMIEPYRGDTPGHGADVWPEAFARTELFTPLKRRTFAHEQEVDADGLVARVASVSFIAALPDEERGHVLSRVRELARPAERVVLPYRTFAYWCERR